MEEESLIRKRDEAQNEGRYNDLVVYQKKLGDLYFNRKHYDYALEAYRGQLQAAEISNNNFNMAMAHRMIQEVLPFSSNSKEAIKHCKLYLQKAETLKDLVGQQRAYAVLGRTYFVEVESYDKESEKDKREEALKNAKETLSKSIELCDQLEHEIELKELMQMRARLLLKLGLVLEHQNKMEDSLKLIIQAAQLCEKYKDPEDLHRTHLALAAHYNKIGDSENALKYMDDAAKVEDNSLKIDAKISKAELLLKLGEWTEARKMLYLLYKTKLPEAVKSQVTRMLKTVVLLCRTDDKLLIESDLCKKLRLHEKMGDAAVSIRALDKAVENYKYMLECAEMTNSSQLGSALISLAQTLKDAGQFEKAIPYAMRQLELCNDPKDSCNCALFAAHLLIKAKSPDNEIREMFIRAIALAKDAKDFNLERLAIRDFVEFLKTMNDVLLTEILELNETLENMPESQPEEDYHIAGEEDTPDIGDEIDLDDLSDLENEFARSKFNPKNIARTLKYKLWKNEMGETSLHIACIEGNVSIAEKLLEENHPTQVYDNCGRSPLLEASNHGFVDIVRLLIHAGADGNDPGGSLCEGVTPLHDAAANGHVAIVNLLLDSGADPNLFTNQGDRALDCLEQWKNKTQHLSNTELQDYAHVRKRLKEMTTVKCKNKDKWKGSGSSNGRVNALVDAGEENCIDERLLSIGKYATTSKPEKISAEEDYKRTIANLQNSGRMQIPEKSTAQPKITAPLTDSEETLAPNDWYEDDLGIFINTRDKAHFGDNGLPSAASTGAKRKVSNECEIADKTTKRPMVNSSVNDRFTATTLNHIVHKSNNTSVFNECGAEPPREIERWPKSNKPRQPNLLKQGFVASIRPKTPPPPPPPKSSEVTHIPMAAQERRDSQESSEIVYMKIQIDREAFDLKLNARDMSKTLKDLGMMITKKFEQKIGFEPSLRYRTMKDDVIDADTVVKTIRRIGNKLEIRGEIIRMDLPSIAERYKIVCKDFDVEPEEATLESLRSCDNTSSFHLKSCEFSDDELEPLVKCLHYQQNLEVLNLSGFSFHYSGDLLNYAITQLSDLCELVLQCCDIGFKCLSLVEKLPLTLRILDLSYNPLGNNSLTKLYKLLEPLEKLQVLGLKSCELTDFPQRYFNASLVDLDISRNSMGSQGAVNLIQRHLIKLSISNTPANVMNKILLSKSLGFTLLNLEFLDLSGVGVTDLDVENISLQLDSLLEIKLSNNIDVTNDSLEILLARKPTMTKIDLCGCRLIDCVPSTSLKIINPRACTVLAHMSSEVIPAWESLWQGRLCTKKLPSSLVLFKPT